jgi:hypothetical protein
VRNVLAENLARALSGRRRRAEGTPVIINVSKSMNLVMGTLVVMSIFLASCFTNDGNINVPSAVQEKKHLEPKKQNSAWEPIFFKEINERARIAKLSDLRSGVLPNDDLEVRVWIGFGLVPLEGFVIKRRSGQWSATHIRSITAQLNRRDYQKALGPPKSGWETFWERLTDEGVLTLPDSSQLKDAAITGDGESFVVEAYVNKSYRTYKYSNPHLQKWPEAVRMINIAKIILEEFNINRRLLASGQVPS